MITNDEQDTQEMVGHKFPDAMTAYLWCLHISDADDHQSSESDGWSRFGRRVVRWDSSGAVNSERHSNIHEARKWCFFNPVAEEQDIYVDSHSEHGYEILWGEAPGERYADTVHGAMAVARDLMKEHDVGDSEEFPNIWLCGAHVTRDGYEPTEADWVSELIVESGNLRNL